LLRWVASPGKALEENQLGAKENLNRFLSGIERRAFRMAFIATGSREESLDLVQETMLRFVRLYKERPDPEWNVLFYRILQSRITDWYRRNAVRKRFMSWLTPKAGEDEEIDPLQGVADADAPGPADHLFRREFAGALLKGLKGLPLRQQQAFLLRAWEGMDVAETAHAMGCSEGSVKTHYSRAVHALRVRLEAFDRD
jgi:RNA polymerase sigma-70 factor (ECF subfamily)